MSAITERDILYFLDGNATKKSLKALEAWALEDLSNAQDLNVYQKIHNELSSLSSYKRVDADWQSVLQNHIQKVEVSERELLLYIDGRADVALTEKIESWKALSQDHKDEVNILKAIVKQSPYLSQYKVLDPSQELDQLFKMKKEAQVIPISSISQEAISKTERSSVFPMWMKMAVAAIGLFLIGAWGFQTFLSQDVSETMTFATADEPNGVLLSDGTMVSLSEHSEITYFSDVDKVDTRMVLLDGQAEFDVASNEQKSFRLTTTDKIGVTVLGTKFTVSDLEGYVKAVKNIEGKVKVYVLEDTSINVVVHPGETYAYTGTELVRIEDTPQDENAKNYEVLYVLDYLMEVSNWKVISSPYTEFDGEDMIMINLDQPYEDILQDLVKDADFSYRKLSCEGCYIVTRFQGE